MGFKIKYDTSKVDRSKQEVHPPKPGVYPMKIAEVKHHPAKDGKGPMLEFVVRMTRNDAEGNGKGYGFWDRVYYTAENSLWKLDQYLRAVGIDTEKKAKGSIDVDTFLNQEITGRVKSDTYDDEYRPKLAAVFQAQDDDEDDDDDDDDDDDEDDDDDDEDDDDDDDDEDDDDDDDEDDDEDDDDDDEDEDEDDEDDDDDEEEETPPPPPAKKKKSTPAPAPAPAAKKKKAAPKKKYEDMELAELKAAAEERGIASKGSKSALIARLRANDDDPFSS